jgi:hypothetical protein
MSISVSRCNPDYLSADAIIALSLELKSRLLQALTCWQVEEYERSATAESRREARIAAVRAIILGGMMNGTTCSPRGSAILTVG